MQETWVRSLGWEDPLGKGTATHSSILAWRIPWTIPRGCKESDTTEHISHTHKEGRQRKEWCLSEGTMYRRCICPVTTIRDTYGLTRILTNPKGRYYLHVTDENNWGSEKQDIFLKVVYHIANTWRWNLNPKPVLFYRMKLFHFPWYPSVQFSHSILSNSLWPHGLQHARPPCPSPTPRVYSNSCPLRQWCPPTISSSVVPFSSHPQSFPASRSFQMSQFFTSGGQSIGASASASVLPMNIQDWFPLGRTGWISV